MDSKHDTGRPGSSAFGNRTIEHFGEDDGITIIEIDNIARIDTTATRSEMFLIQSSSEPTNSVAHRARWVGLSQLVLMNAIISWTVRC